jgi:hypothetical protein
VVAVVVEVVLLAQPAIVRATTVINTNGKSHFFTDLNNLFLLFIFLVNHVPRLFPQDIARRDGARLMPRDARR